MKTEAADSSETFVLICQATGRPKKQKLYHCLSACAIHCVSQPVLSTVSLSLCYPMCLSAYVTDCECQSVLSIVTVSLC